MAQTNSGMRSSVMPGARSLNTVTMISIAPMSAATSVNVISCAQKSGRLPGAVLRAGERHVAEPARFRADVRARRP